MSLWIGSLVILLLLLTTQSQAQEATGDSRRAAIAEVAGPSQNVPARLVIVKKDWYLTRAYADAFAILSNQNECSSFYGGPQTATAVLNGLIMLVKPRPLLGEISFQMTGKPRLITDYATGASYRLFDQATVNSNGSFYQRRLDPMFKTPPDIGNFKAGSRAARALILLHELGHLIQARNGAWLIPDDGYDNRQSRMNTLRVQRACRGQLEALP